MTRSVTLAAASLALLAGACCKETVTARAFFGHKSLDECLKLLDKPEQPVSLTCPGSEITICWKGGGDGVNKAEVAISPDPSGQSGTKSTSGVLYLQPKDNTSVTVKTSDCATTTKQIQVINGPTPASFDAHWDNKCSAISYTLDPNFVDDKIRAIDVTALWAPTVQGTDGSIGMCPTPPFLAGSHPLEVYDFLLDQPNLTKAFTRQLKATGAWNYKLQTCGSNFVCNGLASLPFDMTLTCPAT
jgi:hypothetical protein